MPAAVPSTQPRASREELARLIEPYQIDRTAHPLIVVGIRGFYLDEMGAAGRNERGMYDDAIFIEAAGVTASYNANTDPSIVRKGSGKGTTKGIASLKPGAWFVHRFDKHKGEYLALCQRLGQVTVIRDGDPPYEDTGMFGINIHRGGYNSTSSEGCQTIHPTQWDSFINTATDHAKRWFGADWNKVAIPYVLLTKASA